MEFLKMRFLLSQFLKTKVILIPIGTLGLNVEFLKIRIEKNLIFKNGKRERGRERRKSDF